MGDLKKSKSTTLDGIRKKRILLFYLMKIKHDVGWATKVTGIVDKKGNNRTI
jgi:hypothetical protein